MWLSRFAKNMKHTCRNITLHGCINISESKSAWEMMFWLSVQALCFVLCLWLMIIHWMRYQSRPTVTTIKSTAYPISEISFPAVTVCNSNVVNKNKIAYYEKLLIREGTNETTVRDFFKNLKHLIYLSSAADTDMIQFDEIDKLFQKYDITSEKLMKNIMHPCSEMVENCTWASVKYNCSQMFRPIKTGLGFCCSFNYFNDLTDQSRIAVPAVFKKPIIADGAGMPHGLSMSLKIGVEEYLSPVLPFHACFVMVHPIRDFSDLATFSVTLQPGDFALMQLVPTVFTAEENLRSVSVDKRNCWFENEGHLASTTDYSFTNCVIECKEKAIYELCQCVPYFYPHVVYNSIKIAGSIYLLSSSSTTINHKFLQHVGNIDNSTLCNCWPQCQDVSYDGYVNTIRSSMPDGNSTMILIYFDHSWCVEYNMSLNLTWDMLLASLGGIFGLCLGGSLISLIECLYYLVKSIILAFVQGRQVESISTKQAKKKGVTKFLVQPRY